MVPRRAASPSLRRSDQLLQQIDQGAGPREDSVTLEEFLAIERIDVGEL